MRAWGRNALSAAVVAAAVIPAAAQELTGAITGAVTDGEGRRLVGVTVRATRVATGYARETMTAPGAAYVMALLPPGRYDLLFRLSGFASSTVRDIDLHVNDRLTVNAVLGVGEAERQWRSGERAAQLLPVVQTIVTSRQVDALPLADRSFVPLVALVPGVIFDEDAGREVARDAVTIGGAPPLASGWFLDGAPILDGTSAGLLVTPSPESIAEVRVIVSLPSAEWAHGGVVNVVTKSGTNTLRASAYEFHRSDALDANSFFRNSSVDPGQRSGPPRLRYDTFGYTAGGPIKEDRLFVFWSQEWRRRRGESAADTLDTRQETARVDQASPRVRLMARYTHEAVAAGETDTAGNLLAAQAAVSISATTVNELSYRLADGASGASHTVADDLSIQQGSHTLKVGGLVAHENAVDRHEAYAQDWWRAHRQVSVDAGLRYAEKSLEPRLGVSWRPREHSMTVVRGGFGVYHAPQPVRQWTLGLARTLYDRATIDVAYAGARGESGTPPHSVQYHGLLAAFRHAGPTGLLDLSYTLSRRRSFDRNGEWLDAPADRTHVFTASYVRVVGGWRIAGVTTFQSGPPSPPILLSADGGTRARQVSDPFTNLPSDRYYFSPAAFAPPTPGAPIAAGSPFRLPGRNQWDLGLSRGFALGAGARVELRADAFNLFNHTQFTGVDTRCTASPADTTCAVANTTFGQYTGTRPPREIQLGIRFLWN
jgi:Carboxypeptidase regulatory-like domain